MHLQLLGPVEARLDGRPISLGPTKQRALLAMLALHANATVGVDRLVDGLWGEDPPATAPKMVQLYVSQLRRLLAGDDAEIVTHGRGYELRVSQDAVDVARFERLVEQAGGPEGSSNDAARKALSLWHGDALADVADEPFAAMEIRRLEELWRRAAELAVDAELAGGRNLQALAALERLIEEHPLRERLHAQRMLALYRSGRQAEALEAYVAARRRLIDDAGVEPGAELRELHARILGQDPGLHLPRASVESAPGHVAPAPDGDPPRATGRRVRSRRLVFAAVAALLLGVAGFALTRLTGADRLPGIDDGAVGMIDADGSAIRPQYRLGFEPGAIAAGAGSVWVANPAAGTVARVHRDGEHVDTIDVGRAPTGLAFGAGSLWVANGDDGTVAQVDPSANRLGQPIEVGNGVRALAVGYGAVWAATALDGEVVRLDLRSGRVTRRIVVGGRPVALATGAGAVWVAAEDSGALVRIDPRSGDVLASIGVGHGPSAVAVGLGAVWTANRQDGTVSRVDPATDRVTHSVPAGRDPVALTIAGDSLWIADGAGAVVRLDPRTRAIADTLATGSSPGGLAALGGAVWVTAVAPPAAHRGGTLRVGVDEQVQPDPSWAGYDGYSSPLQGLAYDGLLALRRTGGAAGTELVADLADSVPAAADGGRRYVLRLRPGLRYSDGTPVRAGDFRASMERMLRIEAGGGAQFYEAIEGVAGCERAPTRCDLSDGIATDDRSRTITIRLRRPDPDLLFKLNAPLASVLPPTTPRRPLRDRPIAGTGPYRVERILPGRSILLTRNPYFRSRPGRPAGFPDRIEAQKGNEQAHIAAVERGRLDYAPVFTLTTKQLAALRTRVGSRLQSASNAFTELAYVNVHAPPFDDLRVRRALNLAVDRGRVVDLTGGRDAGAPTCQLLPPGLPGYRPSCPFTVAPSPAGAWTGPDLREARRLVAASGTRGTAIEIWGWAPRARVAHYFADVLRHLGFPTRVRIFPTLAYDHGRVPPQLGFNGWIADLPAPAAFLRALVSCGAYDPAHQATSTNGSRFCDPAIDAAIDRAQAAGPAAGDAWQRIERRIAAQAPVVPLVNRRGVAVISRRARNLQFSPLAGVFFEQLWVR